MKTNIFKLSLAGIALFATLKVYSQSSYQKKTCINIVETVNGKTTHIDTCFAGLSDSELQKQLNALGINDLQIAKSTIDSVKLIIDKEVKVIDSMRNKVIIINDDKSDSIGSNKVNVIIDKNGKNKLVVIGGNGYSYSNSFSNDNSSSETEIIMDTKDKGADSNNNEVKIIVIHSIMVNDLSDSDKLKLRNEVGAETVPFSNLKIYPNPVKTSLIVSYNSSSTEPLQITIYDANGKVVYTETANKPGEWVNKTISLNGYAPGIYFVNLLQGKQQETKKIIVGK